jgi:5-methylcytosine-specific restriction endonuclease McrA
MLEMNPVCPLGGNPGQPRSTETLIRYPLVSRVCRLCERGYRVPVGSHSTDRWACEDCRHVHRVKRDAGLLETYVEKECRWCFTAFIPRTRQHLTCSEECRYSLNRHWRVYRAPDRCHLRLCIECCSIISGPPSGATRCAECQYRFVLETHNKNKAVRHKVVSHGDKGIHWKTLGPRDSWQCHICGKAVVKLAGNFDRRKGAVVDHLVPISAGGRHEWVNVALAHWECNARRGTTGPAQLRLVG